MKYFLAIDIGGTTFNTGLFDESYNLIDLAPKDKIRYYNSKIDIVEAMINQVKVLLEKFKIKSNNVAALGIASPGPLDSSRGIILNTMNLKEFNNFKICEYFKQKLHINTFLQNDANLFAYGEWFKEHSNLNYFVGVTLGTGFGVAFILNGNIYKGSNGMAMEYGTSPFKWGECEKNISIDYIRKISKNVYGQELSPRIIEQKYYDNDENAVLIYDKFGCNLGLALSHVINLLNPDVISLGGGLSKAFNCFKDSMFNSINKYSPIYRIKKIRIYPSNKREISTMIGACIYANARNKENIN